MKDIGQAMQEAYDLQIYRDLMKDDVSLFLAWFNPTYRSVLQRVRNRIGLS